MQGLKEKSNFKRAGKLHSLLGKKHLRTGVWMDSKNLESDSGYFKFTSMAPV